MRVYTSFDMEIPLKQDKIIVIIVDKVRFVLQQDLGEPPRKVFILSMHDNY
jgi:hypothetical protein